MPRFRGVGVKLSVCSSRGLSPSLSKYVLNEKLVKPPSFLVYSKCHWCHYPHGRTSFGHLQTVGSGRHEISRATRIVFRQKSRLVYVPGNGVCAPPPHTPGTPSCEFYPSGLDRSFSVSGEMSIENTVRIVHRESSRYPDIPYRTPWVSFVQRRAGSWAVEDL